MNVFGPFLLYTLLLPKVGFSTMEEVLFDIAHLNIDNSYTKSEIVALWGEPDVYHQHQSEFGLDESYYYKGNNITFNKGLLTFFYVEDRRFPIFTSYVPGGIKVGDPVTVFNQLSFGKLHFRGIAGEFYFQIGEADDAIKVRADEQNKITSLIYRVSV